MRSKSCSKSQKYRYLIGLLTPIPTSILVLHVCTCMPQDVCSVVLWAYFGGVFGRFILICLHVFNVFTKDDPSLTGILKGGWRERGEKKGRGREEGREREGEGGGGREMTIIIIIYM